MADIQGNIIKVDSLVKQLNETFSKHIGYLDAAADSLNKYSTSGKLPSQWLQAQKTSEQNSKNIAKALKEQEKQLKALQRERLSELKLQKKREQAFDKYEKQLEREQKILEKTTGLYNRVQAGINKLTKQYNDLQTRKELGGKLTDAEIIQLGRLEAKLQKYQSVLKKVDANVGKHQRNVGNYKSAFDGLGFSIAQLSRELPAFANSVQTGFMAISNNIPMLVDEITRLKKANVELAASGKPTVNILKRVGSAIFSLQGLLGIAITALTVFAPKLFEWAFGMSEAEKATKKATEELKEQNKALKENIELRRRQISGIKDFINNAQIVDEFKQVFKNVFEGSEDAEAVLRELSERLEKIGVDAKALTDEDIIQSDRLVIAANLLAIEEKRIELEEERNRIDTILTQRKQILERFANKEITTTEKNNLLKNLGLTDLRKTIEIQRRINQLEEANASIIGKTVELESERTKEKKRQNQISVVSEKINKSTDTYVKQTKILISLLEQTAELYDKNSKEGLELKKVIDDLNRSIDMMSEPIKDANKELGEFFDNLQKTRKIYRDWKNDAEKTINDIPKSFIKNSGFDAILPLLDGTFEQMLAGLDKIDDAGEKSMKKFQLYFTTIASIAQQAFALINQFGQENFNLQYERLEAQKNVAIQFAGESATAREEIERQYDEKRRQIQRQQAKAAKETALFEAIIGTASAVVAALPNYVLAGVTAALGAAQIALIQSQQVPQYWQGGIVGSEQQIMVNDDPYGKKGANYKEVIKKPNGQILTPQGKNVKMTVPKGTEIFPTYDAFMNSLSGQLGLNGIGFSDISPNININGGITENQIRNVMLDHSKSVVSAINNKHGLSIDFNESGINTYITKGGQKQKVLNARFRGKGFDV